MTTSASFLACEISTSPGANAAKMSILFEERSNNASECLAKFLCELAPAERVPLWLARVDGFDDSVDAFLPGFDSHGIYFRKGVGAWEVVSEKLLIEALGKTVCEDVVIFWSNADNAKRFIGHSKKIAPPWWKFGKSLSGREMFLPVGAVDFVLFKALGHFGFDAVGSASKISWSVQTGLRFFDAEKCKS